MRVRPLATLLLVPVAVASLGAQAMGIREVSASSRSLIPLNTKIRYTTMILLPDDEEILDVVCGDKDFWVISATQNIAHVKPAKEGAATNLNLVTASGTVYSCSPKARPHNPTSSCTSRLIRTPSTANRSTTPPRR